jgi:hypothetical protein
LPPPSRPVPFFPGTRQLPVSTSGTITDEWKRQGENSTWVITNTVGLGLKQGIGTAAKRTGKKKAKRRAVRTGGSPGRSVPPDVQYTQRQELYEMRNVASLRGEFSGCLAEIRPDILAKILYCWLTPFLPATFLYIRGTNRQLNISSIVNTWTTRRNSKTPCFSL